METQRAKLNNEINALEVQLLHAVLNLDALTQEAINKRIEIAKSILLNLD